MNKGLLYLLIGGGILVMAGRKKAGGGGGGAAKDVTGTLPKRGPHPAPAPETQEQADNEAAYVGIAIENMPTVGPNLGQAGIDVGVPGITEDGFVLPVDNEWLSGWLTRVSYWGAYPYESGAPMMLPPTCILEVTCPDEYLPYRDAMLRIAELVNSAMEQLGIEDVRYSAEAGAFG